MAWPDLSRKLWSYVIAKLGLFTNVDPSKLEVSSKTLKLNEVEVNPAMIDVPGASISTAVIGNLTLELSSAGLSVNASGLEIKGKLDSLEPPELAISMFLENTKADLAEIGISEVPSSQASQSGLVAKLADLALSQISARVAKVNIDLEVNDNCGFKIVVDDAFFSSKHQIELESIALHWYEIVPGDSEDYSEDDLLNSDHSDNDSDATEHDLSKSIYLDAKSRDQLPMVDNAYDLSLIVWIDRLTFLYSLEPVGFDVNIETARFDGIKSLEVIVTVLNAIITREKLKHHTWQRPPTKHTSTEKPETALIIQSLEIFDSLDSTSSPVTLSTIKYESSMLTIESISFPEVLQVSPFLNLEFGEKLLIDLPVPISASIPKKSLLYLKNLIQRVVEIVNRLQPFDEAEPAPFTIKFPEIRISTGDNVQIHLFPNSITDQGAAFSEISMIIRKSQIMIRNATLAFDGSLAIEHAMLKLVPGISEELSSLLGQLSSEGPAPEFKGKMQDYLASLLPDGISIDVACLQYDYSSDYCNSSGRMKCRLQSQAFNLEAKLQGRVKASKAEIEISAKSLDKLKSISATVRCSKLDLQLDDFPCRKGEELNSEPNGAVFTGQNYIPEIALSILFENDAQVTIDKDCKVVLTLHRTELNAVGSSFKLRIPKVYLSLRDPDADLNLIPILKIKETVFLCNSIIKAEVGYVTLMSCADSYEFLRKKIGSLDTHSTVQYILEPDPLLDLHSEIDEDFFCAMGHGFDLPMHWVARSEELDIHENYMGGESKAHFRTRNLPVDSLNLKVSAEVLIRRLKWQLHDGFDFQRTREGMKAALNQVTKIAADIDEPNDSEEPPIIGDFMYNSVLITAPLSRIDSLEKDVAEQLGTSSQLDRSSDAKLVLEFNRIHINNSSVTTTEDLFSRLSLTVKDGHISDQVSTSRYNYVVRPGDNSKLSAVKYIQETLGHKERPEIRAKIGVRPLRISLDQDTVEFINRFFQFTGEREEDTDSEQNKEESEVEIEIKSREASTVDSRIFLQNDGKAFIQKFEFADLPLVLDYTPKKLDYRSLRSGMTAELLNVFAIKEAKVKLRHSVLYGISGWDALSEMLADCWLPDIRDNQLLGLLVGVGPIRRAVKVSKGVRNYTSATMRHKELTKGAGVIVRRTLDEIFRIGSSWLDSTDVALGGG